MMQKIASPEEIELFVTTAVDRLKAKGMSEEVALEKVGSVLQRRAEELGMVETDESVKQAEYDQGAADAEVLIQEMMELKQAEAAQAPAGEGITAEEYVLGAAHEKLVKSGMAPEAATQKLIKYLEQV